MRSLLLKEGKTMNPLSPLTYYLRHKKSAFVQMALITLATVGLFILVGVLESVPVRANVIYITKLSRVFPVGGALDPGVSAQVRTHPGVQRVILDNGLPIYYPTLIGQDELRLLGVTPEDAGYAMDYCGARLKEGRIFAPRSNEIVVSEEVARALNLRLGDEIARAVDKRFYSAVATPLKLVGLLEGTGEGPAIRLGFVSNEYLSSHELYTPRRTGLLVAAAPGQKAAVDSFLETAIDTSAVDIETFTEIARFVAIARVSLRIIFGVVNTVVAVVVAFVVGVINQIAMSMRLSELGVLHALGHSKPRLVRRMTLETAAVAGAGTLIGLGLALLALAGIRSSVFYNLGMELDLFNPTPFFFVLPIPVVVVAMAYRSIRRIFARLDAVAVVERGHLSEEPQRVSKAQRSVARPLSAFTFYLRHRRRSVMLALSIALVVLGVTFPVFLLSSAISAMQPESDYLNAVSKVYPANSSALDPGVVSQIKSHPAVQQVIPALELGIQMEVPPGGATDVDIYGVSETDLPTLLATFGVQVQKGHLPRPRSNEIALSAAVAANRGLRVGTVVGQQSQTDVGLIQDDIPVEMVVVGILAPDHPWFGVASLEYLQSHELVAARTVRLLVVPQPGRQEEAARWLEEAIASNETAVVTHAASARQYRALMGSLALTFALLEGMIALVAAIAMVTLNTIFFIQRKDEFGVLNAIGHSRRWLIRRTLKETGSVTGIAWLIGATLCGVGLLGMQALLYAPRGLSLDFFNVIPWAFTAPMPLSVVLASALTVGRMLRKLDPVAVIEQVPN
jgi:ABC-type lipoprotein release transport system permease subunit